jgi:ABC-type branched-subunit amino acid transport system substrate-binding protein
MSEEMARLRGRQVFRSGGFVSGARASLVVAVMAAFSVAGISFANAAGASASASKSPYVVAFMADLSGTGGQFTPDEAALKGYVKAANHSGGINGHPLQLDVCDTALSTSAAAACGQTVVGEHAIAAISSSLEDTMIPYLQQANIPYLNTGNGILAGSSSVSFVMTDAQADELDGAIGLLAKQGCKSIGNIVSSAYSSVMTAGFAVEQAAAKLYGVSLTPIVYVPATAADLAPYVTEEVATGAQCVLPNVLGAQLVSLMQDILPATAMKHVFLGDDTITASGEDAAVGPTLTKLGSRLVVGSIAVSATETKNPAVAQWVSESAKFGPKPEDLASENEFDFAELQLILYAGEHVSPHVSGSSIVKYLDTLHNYWPGIEPAVSFDKPGTSLFGPRIVAGFIVQAKWTGGKTFPTEGDFVSVLNGKDYTSVAPPGSVGPYAKSS